MNRHRELTYTQNGILITSTYIQTAYMYMYSSYTCMSPETEVMGIEYPMIKYNYTQISPLHQHKIIHTITVTVTYHHHPCSVQSARKSLEDIVGLLKHVAKCHCIASSRVELS